MASLTHMAVVKLQLRRLSQGRAPAADTSPAWALLTQQVITFRLARRYRKRMELQQR